MAFLRELAKGKAIGRALLFEKLKILFEQHPTLGNKTSVLDIGSQKASHERAFPRAWNITTSNYVKEEGIDLVIDVNKKFPLDANTFDGVTIFNTLYLADDYMSTLRESLRVARSFVIFNIPLTSSLAPHPVDMNRLTKDRLRQTLELLRRDGLSDYKIITVGGSFSAALSLIEYYAHFRIIKIPLGLLARALDRLDVWRGRECPVQYLVLMLK